MMAESKKYPMNLLYAAWLETVRGKVIAVADDKSLYILQFEGGKALESQVERLRKRLSSTVVFESNAIIKQVEKELHAYFAGTLRSFTVPLAFSGTVFQETVWQALQAIPYGTTCSYADLAQAIGRPTAFRAVARANSTNHHGIIVPCHRVINKSGKLGGYAGGLLHKQALLKLERP